MHCAGFLLLYMTTFAPRTKEDLRVHKLTLPHENLKLKNVSEKLQTLLEFVTSKKNTKPKKKKKNQCLLCFIIKETIMQKHLGRAKYHRTTSSLH